MKNDKILSFINKRQAFKYIQKKFGRNNKIILIRGSTAYGKVKNFSDFDIEVHGVRTRKPQYEIILINNKLILISAYFYKYHEGKKIKSPKNIRVIYGNYNDKIKPDFSKDRYNNKERVIRECQLIIDFLFKYLRSGNKEYLKSVQRRLN